MPLARLEGKSAQIAAWRATLSPGSRYGATQALRQALDQAVRWNVIGSNPATLAGKNPAPKRTEIVPFTPDELDRICGELGPHAPLVRVAAATGLRPCEWLALEWRDVRSQEGVILVERTYSRGALRAYGKASRSRRRVPLSRVARQALESVPRRIDSQLIFPARNGRYLDLHNWRSREWPPAVTASGVDHGTIYTLRHTFATSALAAGLGLYELSRFMGTSVEMIDRTYGHLAVGAEDAARAKLDSTAASSRQAASRAKRCRATLAPHPRRWAPSPRGQSATP